MLKQGPWSVVEGGAIIRHGGSGHFHLRLLVFPVWDVPGAAFSPFLVADRLGCRRCQTIVLTNRRHSLTRTSVFYKIIGLQTTPTLHLSRIRACVMSRRGMLGSAKPASCA